jgi:putative ABC transport system permease protein
LSISCGLGGARSISAQQTINLPDVTLAQVRAVDGVRHADLLALATVDARFLHGRFQSFPVIGVDGVTLARAPATIGVLAGQRRANNPLVVDAGGTEGTQQTPVARTDQWPHDGVHLDAPTRELERGDELLVTEPRVRVLARSRSLPRPVS